MMVLVGFFLVLAGVVVIGARLIIRKANRIPWNFAVLGLGVAVMATLVGWARLGKLKQNMEGYVTDCRAAPEEMQGLAVRVYDPESNRELLSHLRLMDAIDTASGPSGIERFRHEYARLEALLPGARFKARDTVNSCRQHTGKDSYTSCYFFMRVRESDSVLLLVQGRVAWTPFYYAYRVVPHRVETPSGMLSLDMSRGACRETASR